jgi:DNA-binding transcriptional MerR regulator
MDRLAFTTGRAAAFLGVTRRKLAYWTESGLVPAGEEKRKKNDSRKPEGNGGTVYNTEGLCRALLIMQVRERGRGLRWAGRQIRAHLARRRYLHAAHDGDGALSRDALGSLAQRLEQCARTMKALVVGRRLGDRAGNLACWLARMEALGAHPHEGSDGRFEPSASWARRTEIFLDLLEDRLSASQRRK